MGLNRNIKCGGDSLSQTENNSLVLTSFFKNKKRQQRQRKIYVIGKRERGKNWVSIQNQLRIDSLSQTEIQLVINSPAVFHEKLE
jgi:hypothetical protein